jgi:hypothetical protein
MSDDTVSPDNVNREPTPLEPEQLDDLLSAELDGEFEPAARELGLSVPDAEARVRATPGADERRVALAQARDLLGVAPPIDELLAARLRAKAVRAAEAEHEVHTADRRRRRNRVLLSAGGIAAAVAAIVAVANGMSGYQPDSSSSSKSASSPSSSAERALAPTTHAAAVAALGSFADSRSLALAAVQQDAVTRALADSRLKGSLQTTDAAGTGRAVPATTTAPAPVQNQNGAGSSTTKVDVPKASAGQSAANPPRTQYDANARSAASCGVPPQVPAGDAPVLRATATLAGKPVIVLVFANATERIVVIEDTNCKLVNLQMFR